MAAIRLKSGRRRTTISRIRVKSAVKSAFRKKATRKSIITRNASSVKSRTKRRA